MRCWTSFLFGRTPRCAGRQNLFFDVKSCSVFTPISFAFVGLLEDEVDHLACGKRPGNYREPSRGQGAWI